MKTPEEINFINDVRQNGKKQIIVPHREKNELQDILSQVQNKYKQAGAYRDIGGNIPEEKIAEIAIFQKFKRELPNWNVYLRAVELSKLDIELKHKTKNITLTIEVKTKPEEPEKYIWKFENDDVDITAGIPAATPESPTDRLLSLLKNDYVIFSMTSYFGKLSTQYEASSSTPIGGFRKGDFQTEDFDRKQARTAYYVLDLTKHNLRYRNNVVDEIITEIKNTYD